MPGLLRKINREAWAAACDSPLWGQGDCPPEAIKQVVDSRGSLSMWRIDDPAEIPRVIAAQAIMQKTVSEFSYVVVDEAILHHGGILIKGTPNEHTPDPAVNQKHVDVDFRSGKVLFDLARLMVQQGKADVMTKQAVLEELRKRFADTSFDRAHLFGKKRDQVEQEISKSLLIKLWKDGTLGIL